MQTETRSEQTLGAGDSPAIEFEGLTKSYRADVKALDSLTLTVPQGEIFGFLGPNGAGKTTTIRTMLDLIRPTSGSVRIFGENCNDGSAAVRGRVGYLPGDLSVYPNMNGRDVVDLFASLRPGHVREEWVRELADRLSLDLRAKSRELSHGNKQKVGIVLALMVEPDLIILDEPTSGLDPLAQRTVLEILHEMNRRGATVFISSHNLTEVERICHRVGMIRMGKLIAVKEIEEVVSQRMIAISVTFDSLPPDGAFANLDGVRETGTHDDGKQITFEAVGEVDALIKAIATHRVLAIESVQPSLEEEFMALYEGDATQGAGSDA